MESDYSYPLDLSWSSDEMVTVVQLWSALEEAYEKGIEVENFLQKYRAFKTVVQSIGEEKSLGRTFEEGTGYSLYKTVKRAEHFQSGRLKMSVTKK